MSLHKAIQAATEGGFLNGPFEATVSYPEAKEWQGRTFYVAKLTDGPTTAKISGNTDLNQFNGKRVEFTMPFKQKGAYVKWKKTYKNTPELGMGDAVVVNATTSGQAAQQHSEATQAYPTQQSAAPVTGNQTQGYDGATVGCAAHCASRIVAAELRTAKSVNDAGSRHYELMSEIIKNMQKVQAGVLYFAAEAEPDENNPPF